MGYASRGDKAPVIYFNDNREFEVLSVDINDGYIKVRHNHEKYYIGIVFTGKGPQATKGGFFRAMDAIGYAERMAETYKRLKGHAV